MSKPRRPRHPNTPGKPQKAPPAAHGATPASDPVESIPASAETLAEMAALAPEPAPVEATKDFASEAVHARETVSEALAEASAATFDQAGEAIGDAVAVAPPALHAVTEEEASEPACLPAVITVPTLVGAVTTPAVPRITALQFGAESFGTTVMSYVMGEGEAFASHMRALAGARSMADFVRLQIGEFQRAADATLTCWGRLTVSASRTAVAR